MSQSQPHVGNQFLKKLLVRCDHTPESSNELAVRKGEMVELIKRDEEWSFVRNDRGKEGYIPNNKCITPMGSSRPRLNSINGPRGVHQVTTDNQTPDRTNRVIPMYSSSSAGRAQRHRSPLPNPEQENLVSMKRVQSPHISPNGSILLPREGSSATLDPKHSPSSSIGVPPYSTAMIRAYSQDELKPRNDDDSMCSLSQSAADPQAPPPLGSFKKNCVERNGHRKQSSSDESGTVDIKEIEYSSTIRTGDSSSEDGSLKPGKGSTGSNTPSYRDRPLPSPPKEVGNTEERAPPPPPRHASLDRNNKRGPRVSPGDMDPYASPIDSIVNGGDSPTSILSDQTRGRRDIQCKDTGINSPYSEVFRPPKGYRRPVNLQDTESSPHRSSFHRNRSPIAVSKSAERRDSPLMTNEDQRQYNHTLTETPTETSKGLAKFRKTRWGVYVCTEVRCVHDCFL